MAGILRLKPLGERGPLIEKSLKKEEKTVSGNCFARGSAQEKNLKQASIYCSR